MKSANLRARTASIATLFTACAVLSACGGGGADGQADDTTAQAEAFIPIRGTSPPLPMHGSSSR